MKVFSILSLLGSVAAAPVPHELLLQVQELQAELSTQRQVIQELQEERRLQAAESESIDDKITKLQDADLGLGGALDSAWLVLCGALVMFMHAGFAMLETGCCRAKNASNVLMKNLVNVCCGTLGWWSIGWALAYGEQNGNGFIGTDGFFGFGFYTRDKASGVITPVECTSDGCQSTMLSWFFQWAFCTAGATIVSGAVAERVKSPTYAAFAFLMTSFIYPMVVASTWGGGWLASLFGVGYMDFAGSGVVHLTGGISGLIGTTILGARTGRFTNPEEFECHNLPLVVLGTFALWFGWYGFNPGSTLTMKSGSDGALAAQVAMNTTLAAATGGITVFLLRYVITHKYDVGALCNGILAGLVSITAGCGNMESGSAVATGLIGGFVYQAASMLLQKLRIDDPVDASPVHGFCGAWGLIATGLFDWGRGVDHYHGWSGFGCMEKDDGGCQTGIGGTAIGVQFIMILAIVAWAGTLSGIGFFLLKITGALRYGTHVEEVGIDSHHHSPPKELRLRLAHLEQVQQQQRDEAAAAQAALEAENRQLKRSLADKEDELVMLNSKLENRFSAESFESDTLALSPSQAAKIKEVGMSKQILLDERAVVEDIRKARLVGVDAELLPEDIRRGVMEMRRSLTAAVDRLAKDLYESQAHFLQELLQNADDNKYADGVVPKMDLVLRSRPSGVPYFFAANNEIGLSEVDVRALCDISRSSKTQAGGTTGYKGVGWKSVFRVCEAPHVLSRNWRFKFSSTGLGMLTPVWLEDEDVCSLPKEVLDAHQRGETVFYLPLADPGISVPSIRAEMQTIEADFAQLLFLRRVMQISLRGDWTAEEGASGAGPDPGPSSVVMSASVSPNGVRTTTCCQQYHEDKEGGTLASEKKTSFEVQSHEDVVVALPLLPDAPPSQRVFAFLPVRSVGFRFAVQAPFHLTASRADLHRSPENLRRRNAVAPAFIKACQESFEVASRALEYLGTEPAEPFWMPVRQKILEELRNLACVATESGQAVPDQCLLRGSLPAAQWIPNDLLQEASGFSFVDKSAGIDTLHELGVREFGHEELVACIQYCNGRWLQSLWREQNRRSAAFNDLYKSLLDSILEDPARLSAVQNLSIFPVASPASKTLRGALFNEVDLCNSIGLHTAPCGTVSQSVQTHLVRCLEPSLEMSSQSLRLLQLLGVEPVSEAELEASAFRTLLQIRKPGEVKADTTKKARQSEIDTNFDHKSYWCAMTVLKTSYLKGRQPEAGWDALKGAANLLSHSQQLVPASRLRLWSFLGVELRLPPALISNICSIAGIESEEAPSRHYVERAASAPSLDPSRESEVPSLESNLGWEVFMCNVFNCQPADPLSTSIGGPPLPEGFLESFLRLGQILTTGQFWQKAAGSPMTLDYLSRVMHLNRRSESAFARRNFLRKLSARSKAAPHGMMQDLFLQEVFQSLAGCYLPYISGVPSNPRVHSLLRWCGVSTEIDEFSLVKALRFVRDSDIQDLGLVSEIYRRLYNCGFNPDEEKIFLVPGKGFVSKSQCVWRPFKSELLRRCCQLEVLQDHYSRFGADVRTALCTSWIRECPETSAKALCESLIMAIECARVDSTRHLPGKPSIPPQEAAAKLFPASKAAIEDLVKLCVGTCLGMDLIPPEPSQRLEDKRPDGVVFNHFVQRRMIVVPGAGEGDVQCRILSMGEAYWDVVPELAGTPAEDVALKTHYGVGGNEEATVRFFTEVLHVKPFLTLDDWTVICQTSLHFVPQSDSNGTIEEGLKLFQVPSSGNVPWDIESVVDSVYEKLRHLPAPMEGPEHSVPQSDSTPGRRTWRYVGLLGGGLPFFAANGAEPPPVTMSQQELMLVLSLCRHFGIHPRQIGFAYDPTGASVCRERLFLDIKYLQRARLLQSQAGYHAVVSFWAGKLARMLGNLGQVPSAGASAFRDRLLQEVLPAIFQADGDFH